MLIISMIYFLFVFIIICVRLSLGRRAGSKNAHTVSDIAPRAQSKLGGKAAASPSAAAAAAWRHHFPIAVSLSVCFSLLVIIICMAKLVFHLLFAIFVAFFLWLLLSFSFWPLARFERCLKRPRVALSLSWFRFWILLKLIAISLTLHTLWLTRKYTSGHNVKTRETLLFQPMSYPYYYLSLRYLNACIWVWM